MGSRFEFVLEDMCQCGSNSYKKYSVFVDKQTGVQYVTTGHSSAGATVLLNKDGKPLLHPRYSK